MKHLTTYALPAALLAAAAWATTLLALDVAGLTRLSDAVVRGTVVRVEARLTGDGARIMTDAELQVSEVLKGAPGPVVIVMQPGGEVGDVGQHVDGAARFTPGEEVVAFLEARGDRWLVTGMVQGKFRVERSSDGRAAFARAEPAGDSVLLDPVTHQPVSRPAPVLTLDALRAQVKAALPAAPQPPATPGPTPVTPTPRQAVP